MKTHSFKNIIAFFDLKSKLLNGHTPGTPKKETANESRKDYFLSDHGFYTHVRISEVRGALRWQLQDKELHLLGSISLHGICSTDIPGKPQRYPGMLKSSAEETLSHGHPWQGLSEYSRERQSGKGLENLC